MPGSQVVPALMQSAPVRHGVSQIPASSTGQSAVRKSTTHHCPQLQSASETHPARLRSVSSQYAPPSPPPEEDPLAEPVDPPEELDKVPDVVPDIPAPVAPNVEPEVPDDELLDSPPTEVVGVPELLTLEFVEPVAPKLGDAVDPLDVETTVPADVDAPPEELTAPLEDVPVNKLVSPVVVCPTLTGEKQQPLDESATAPREKSAHMPIRLQCLKVETTDKSQPPLKSLLRQMRPLRRVNQCIGGYCCRFRISTATCCGSTRPRQTPP